MARKKKNTEPQSGTRTEADASPEEIAKIRAEADAALLEELKNRKKTPTVGDQFVNIATLISDIRKSTRLSEGTLVKLWELNLMWELNTRQTRQPELPPFEYEEPNGGEGTGPSEDLPTPNEVLGDNTPSEE